jgi:hypothetical protein
MNNKKPPRGDGEHVQYCLLQNFFANFFSRAELGVMPVRDVVYTMVR